MIKKSYIEKIKKIRKQENIKLENMEELFSNTIKTVGREKNVNVEK